MFLVWAPKQAPRLYLDQSTIASGKFKQQIAAMLDRAVPTYIRDRPKDVAWKAVKSVLPLFLLLNPVLERRDKCEIEAHSAVRVCRIRQEPEK